MISPQAFAAICYLIIMTGHGKGVDDKHPSYVLEKLEMLGEGYNAFTYLDLYNMRRVIDYLMVWKYPVPPIVLEAYNAEEKAFKELNDLGIETGLDQA